MYFSAWKTNINIKESLSLSANARLPLREALADPERMSNAPLIPTRPLQPNQVNAGFLSESAQTHAPTQAPIQVDSAHLTTQLSRKRVATALENTRPTKKVRARRHCAKCGSETCNGKQKVAWCLNRCRDCNRSDCRGRDTKRPNVACFNLN
jgi:hypothetical protein